MPEIPTCARCRKPIWVQEQDYVIINKDIARGDYEWRYAHAECQQKHIDGGGDPHR